MLEAMDNVVILFARLEAREVTCCVLLCMLEVVDGVRYVSEGEEKLGMRVAILEKAIAAVSRQVLRLAEKG